MLFGKKFLKFLKIFEYFGVVIKVIVVLIVLFYDVIFRKVSFALYIFLSLENRDTKDILFFVGGVDK